MRIKGEFSWVVNGVPELAPGTEAPWPVLPLPLQVWIHGRSLCRVGLYV